MRSRSRTTLGQPVISGAGVGASQQVIAPGRVSKLSTPIGTGSNKSVSPAPDTPTTVVRYNTTPNAWNNVPYVGSRQSTSPVINPSISKNADAVVDINEAQTTSSSLSANILTDENSILQSFTITGNGSATRWRFPIAGAPRNVIVTNLSTDTVISSSLYSITNNTDGFAWIVFDTAPTSSVNYNISYDVGSSGTTTVTEESWSSWQAQIRSIENRLNNIKLVTDGLTTNARYIASNKNAKWSLTDPTIVNDAQAALNSLKVAIKTPGNRMDLTEINSIIAFLNSQLGRIDSELNKSNVIDGIRPGAGGAPVFQNTDVVVASRIYDNDIRYRYFSGPESAAIYNPPNSVVASPQRWTKRFDAINNRYYYSIV